MKLSPYMIIISSAVVAGLALLLYFYQTSPSATDPQSAKVTVENQNSNGETSANTPSSSPNSGQADASSSNQEQEAALQSQGQGEGKSGINLARVRPDGNAIVAGESQPGSTINLMRDGKIIGSAVASDQGEWVIIPEELLDLGSHLLSIEIIHPDGRKEIGELALAIDIISRDETPLVALVPYTEDSTATASVLQAPESLSNANASAANETAVTKADQVDSSQNDQADAGNTAEKTADESSPTAAMAPRITIRSIQALNPKVMSVSGHAEGGALVTMSINGQVMDEARPDAQSMYAVSLPIDKSLESFEVKAQLFDADNNALASARIRLSQAQIEQGMDGNSLIVIHKGDALWRIAYKSYGAGIRYVDIVRQNATEIDDPDLIYPDQIFVIPNG
jgi:nucleoid-associated protein YgaU